MLGLEFNNTDDHFNTMPALVAQVVHIQAHVKPALLAQRLGPLMQDVERKVQSLDGIDKVVVDLTFDPPWTPERMSEEARLTTGLY